MQRPMLAPQSESCFPFLDPESNCCLGSLVGGKCDSNTDCRGLTKCVAGSCSGESGCEHACNMMIDGETRDCCVPESYFNGACTSDTDCQGARYCTYEGFCAGSSGCQERSSGQRVIYDKACVCTNTGGFCSYSHGIPCANGCSVTVPAPGLMLCSRHHTFSGVEAAVLPL